MKRVIYFMIIVFQCFYIFSYDKAFFRAVKAGDVASVSSMLSNNPGLISDKDMTKQEAVVIAVKNGDFKMLELLVKKGADVNAVDVTKTPILIIALKDGNNEIADFILENDVDLSVTDYMDNSAIHIAAENNFSSTIRLLAVNGASLDKKNKKGLTPLQIAIKTDSKGAIDTLIKNGADLNVRDALGNTLVNKALKQFNIELAEVLIKNGADLNLKNSIGKNPLLIISNNSIEEINENEMRSDIYSKLSQADRSFIMKHYKRNIPVQISTDEMSSILSKVTDKSLIESSYSMPIPLDFNLTSFLQLNKDIVNPLHKDFLVTVYSEDDRGEEGVYFVFNPDIENKRFKINQLLDQYKYDENNEKEQLLKFIVRDILKEANYYKKNNISYTLGKDIDQSKIHSALKGINFEYEKSNVYTLTADSKSMSKIKNILFDIYYKNLASEIVSKTTDVNTKDKLLSRTALHYAVQNENLYLSELLLDNGARINEDDMGNNVFHVIAKNNTKSLFSLLADVNQGINAQDKGGRTPLHYAVINSSLEHIDYFISKGADLSIKDRKGMSPVIQSVITEEPSIEVLKRLTNQSPNLNDYIYNGKTLLHLAAKAGNKVIVDFLLDNRININQRVPLVIRKSFDELTYTLLTSGLSKKEKKTIDRFYKKGGASYKLKKKLSDKEITEFSELFHKVRLINGDAYYTALHFAAAGNDPVYLDIIRVLTEQGADMKSVDFTGLTPLHIAATRGYNIIKEVITYYSKDELDIRDKNGRTALHHAVENGVTSVVDIMIGLPVVIKDDDFDALFGCGKLKAGEIQVVKSMYDYNEGVYKFIENVSMDKRRSKDRANLMSILNKCGYIKFDVNAQDNIGWTPLHVAVSKLVQPEIVFLLLEAGADTGVKDKYHKTPDKLLNVMASVCRPYRINLKKISHKDIGVYKDKYKGFEID